MKIVSLPLSRLNLIWQGTLLLAGILLGIFIALLPLELSILGLLLASIGFLVFITPFSMLIFLLVIAPLRVLMQTESALVLPLDIGQLAFIVFGVIWMVHYTLRRQNAWRSAYTPLYIPLLIFMCVISVGVFYAGSTSAWLTETLKWVVILLLVFIIFDMCRYNRRWEWAVLALVSAGAGQAIVGLYTFFGGSGADHLIIDAQRAIFRAFGTFGQPNPFGGFMGLLAPLSVMLVVGYWSRAWHLWRIAPHEARQALAIGVIYVFASIVICAGVIASWSRGAWLGFGIAMLALLVAYPRKLWHGAGILLFVLAIVGVLWLSGRLPTSLTDRISSATQELFVLTDVRGVDISPENYAVIERLAHWQAALNMARENIWLGVGFGNYDFAYEEHRLINWKFSLGHAHNYYLNVLAETGIIGFVAYIGVLVSLLMVTWKTRKHPDTLSRATAVGLLGTWIYLITHSMTDNLFVNNVFIHFGVMVGVLAVISHPLIIHQKVTIS